MATAPTHRYASRLEWTGNRGSGTSSYADYGREYRIEIEGKPVLVGTANVAFRGRADLHDPEDLLVAALSSCHLLAYLALCAREGVRVLGYTGTASGTLVLDSAGGGRFEEVTLRPVVQIAADSDLQRARALHEVAHERCFIASSCNFPVHVEASVEPVADAAPRPV